MDVCARACRVFSLSKVKIKWRGLSTDSRVLCISVEQLSINDEFAAAVPHSPRKKERNIYRKRDGWGDTREPCRRAVRIGWPSVGCRLSYIYTVFFFKFRLTSLLLMFRHFGMRTRWITDEAESYRQGRENGRKEKLRCQRWRKRYRLIIQTFAEGYPENI